MTGTPASAGAEYAPASGRPTSNRRRALAWGGLVAAILAAGFVALGFWQWNKYATRTTLQAELDERSHGAVVTLPGAPVDAESLRFRPVAVIGEFDAAHQILLDNRVDAQTARAVYHVLTPLRIAGSELAVLVNRGWIAAAPDRRLPAGLAPRDLPHQRPAPPPSDGSASARSVRNAVVYLPEPNTASREISSSSGTTTTKRTKRTITSVNCNAEEDASQGLKP